LISKDVFHAVETSLW